MKNFLKLSAAAVAATVMTQGVAQAATINVSDATCIANCTGTTSGTTPAGVDWVGALKIGTVLSLDNPSFVDANGAYDARVEVVGLSANVGNGASSINVGGVNNWMQLRFSFVDEGTLSTTNTTGVARTLSGVRFINVFDIDSNTGSNNSKDDFTDVAGINKTLSGLGGALEEGGFLAGDEPAMDSTGTENFTYVRLDEDFVPDDGGPRSERWENEPNYKPGVGLIEDDFIASFDAGGDLDTFEFVWGSTGVTSGNIRGFEISITADPELGEIPVPAAAFLFAPAMGLAAWRKRKAAK